MQLPCRQGQQVTVTTGAGGPEPDHVALVALDQYRAMIKAGFGQLSLTALEAWGKKMLLSQPTIKSTVKV